MLTPEQMQEICDRITFPKMRIFVGTKIGLYLQVRFRADCVLTGEDEEQHGRKWLLSTYMTPGEVVQTAFKAILTAQEHEAREQFRYMGVSVFNPHFDINRLVALAMDPTSVQEREKR